MLTATVERIAAEWPTAVDADPSIERSLAFLDSDLDADRLLAASYLVAAAAFSVIPVALLVVPSPIRLPAILVPSILAVSAVLLAREGPRYLARVRRTRALGAAPTLLTYATLRMRLAPVPERAAEFAGETVDGPLGDSLEGHVERSGGGPRTGLDRFAAEWAEWFPALERGSSLLESAATTPADRRPAALDRARSAVLEGTRERMTTFGSSVRGPTTGVYAFGVFLPLSLVSLVPAVRAAGVPTPVFFLVVIYDLLLPAALLVTTLWLLGRRPMAFPPPAIDRSHPDVPGSLVGPVVAGLAAGAIAWFVAATLLQPWTAPVATLGAGVGTGLVAAYRPMVAVRREIVSVETDMGDAMTTIGRLVAGGTAVERAVATVAEESDGPFAAVLVDAAGRQRRLGVDLERALLGDDGALADLSSDRLRGAGAMLATAVREGEPAGDAIVALSDHLEDLHAVERETRRSVESVTSTLSNTAAIFGPLVGGVTVALASAMGGPGPFAGAGDVSGLGLAVGVYVLLLAVILAVLTTGLSRGIDRSLVGYRAGLAVLSATAIYLTAVTAGTSVV